jgi:iron(III) transport system substrate-binding protein
MEKRALLKAAMVLAGLFTLGSGVAQAQGNLVMYCSVNEQWCRALATTFQQQTGIRVDMTRQSSGEVYARLRAERNNPRGDLWFGGTGDPHLQAAAEELTEPYQSPTLPTLQDWAQRQAQRSGYRTVGVYMGALGYGYNETELRRRSLPVPACWSDLLKPEFRGEVQMADPNASGTAYTMLATLVQMMGEEPAFDYLKRLHRNIDQYTSVGAAPAQAMARGETLIGIVFQHDAVDAQRSNPNVRVVSPCEGTGYEIGSMSIVHGARNPEQAKRFYEWVLTPAAQALGASNGSLQVPSNPATPLPAGSPDLSQIRLIDYDFAKYGSSAERTRLLARWSREVKNAR